MLTELMPLVRRYAAGLWQRRWAVVLVAVPLCLIAWTAIALLPNRYEAKAEVYIDTQSIIGPLMKDLAVTPDVEGQVQMMRQTLLARPNLELLARETGLDLAAKTPREAEAVLVELERKVKVTAKSKSLYEIAYAGPDPTMAYRVVTAVLDLFVEGNLGHSQRDVDAARAFIDRQIAEYEGKLRLADLALARFRREHADELGGVERAQRDLEQAEFERRSIESERSSAVFQREQLAAQVAATLPRLSQAEATALPTPAATRLAGLQTELDQLMLVYTDRHPKVVNLKGLLGQAEAALAKERGGSVGGAPAALANPVLAQLQERQRAQDQRVADLERRAALVQAEIGRLAAKVSESPAVEADLVKLTRDYDTLSKNYQELVQRRETASLAKKLDTETSNIEFRVVEPPLVPITPSGPPHGLLMIAAAVVGWGAGLGGAGLRIALRDEVVRAEQLEELFDLPVLGSVGLVRAGGRTARRALEGAALAIVLVAFAASFATVVYFYQFRAEKPDLMAKASALAERFGGTLPASL